MNNIFDNVSAIVSSLTSSLQGIALGVIILCLVITGLMFLFGEGPSRAAKKWLVWIVVGGLIVFCAAAIGNTIQSVSGF